MSNGSGNDCGRERKGEPAEREDHGHEDDRGADAEPQAQPVRERAPRRSSRADPTAKTAPASKRREVQDADHVEDDDRERSGREKFDVPVHTGDRAEIRGGRRPRQGLPSPAATSSGAARAASWRGRFSRWRMRIMKSVEIDEAHGVDDDRVGRGDRGDQDAGQASARRPVRSPTVSCSFELPSTSARARRAPAGTTGRRRRRRR